MGTVMIDLTSACDEVHTNICGGICPSARTDSRAARLRALMSLRQHIWLRFVG